MIYHHWNDPNNDNNNNNNRTIINRIINLDLDVLGGKISDIDINNERNMNFYPFEDQRGNGIIVKLNSEGDEYKICAESCECIVECENNKDCANNNEEGMICVENVCIFPEDDINRRRKRKETKINERNRRIAISVPMYMCVFGVFTSVYYAIEYGNKYFSEKCDESCPGYAKVKGTDVKKTENDIFKKYKCSGSCFLPFLNSIMMKKVVENLLYRSVLGGKKSFEYQKVVDHIFEFNIDKYTKECSKISIIRDEIASDIIGAKKLFSGEANIICKDLKYTWEDKVLENKKTGSSFLPIFEYEGDGKFTGYCNLAEQTVVCVKEGYI